MKFFSVIIFISLYGYLNSKQVCYDGYGCFHDDTDLALPNEPSKINTTFYLYNRENGNEEETVSKESFKSFKPSLKTKFIVHGFRNNAKKQWVIDMKNEIIKAENVNVILVDWSYGNGHPYSKAAGNTQIVGIDVAKFILNLITSTNAKAEDFHLIGYSLGAHISGNAGRRIPDLGRITALDASSVYFEDIDDLMRLDKTDALFVDVIHTDGSPKLGMGRMSPMGHVDFYPNEGKNQPGCASSNTRLFKSAWTWLAETNKEARKTFSCSHRSSKYFFTDSINGKCKYYAYACKDYEHFENGLCIKCSENGCNQMGYWASRNKDLGNLYLKTKPLTESESYCKQHYQVKLYSNNLEGMKESKGRFKIFWKTENHVSPTFLIKSKGLELESNTTTSVLINLDEPINEDISTVFISYKRTSNYLIKYFYDQYWSFKHVEIYSGSNQTQWRFCPLLKMIKSGTTAIFKKC